MVGVGGGGRMVVVGEGVVGEAGREGCFAKLHDRRYGQLR